MRLEPSGAIVAPDKGAVNATSVSQGALQERFLESEPRFRQRRAGAAFAVKNRKPSKFER